MPQNSRPDSPICFPSAGPSSLPHRCHGDVVGGHPSVHLPTLVDSPGSGDEGQEGTTRPNSDSPSLAIQGMVPHPPQSRPLSTDTSPPKKWGPVSTEVRDTSRQPPNSQLTYVEVMRKYMRRRGSSKNAIKLFQAQHRPSTSKLYDLHWRKWVAWCKSNKVKDPMRLTACDIANHLSPHPSKK